MVFHGFPRPVLFFRKAFIPVLSSQYHAAVPMCPLQHTPERKLLAIHAPFKIMPPLCRSLKRIHRVPVCTMCQTASLFPRMRCGLSSYLLLDKHHTLFCECCTSKRTVVSSGFDSTSARIIYSNSGAGLITSIESDAELETFLSQVKSDLNLATSSKAYATSMQNLRPLVQKLVSVGCDCRNVHAFLVANPGVLSVKVDRLLGNIDYLCMLGINWRRLLKTLSRNSALWKASVKMLESRVTQLRKLGLVEGQLQKMISDWPQVLMIQSTQLNAVVKVLMEKCGFSRADVLTILVDSPAVLSEDLETIELRFQYAYFRMGIQNNSEMTQAKIFKYSLDHLRCRHLILERLGLYVAPNNRGQFAKENPKLARIIDCSDGRFTEKIARIRKEDYDVFARTLLEEIEVQKLDEKGEKHERGLDEFTDEDSHYDSDDDIDSDTDSDSELSHDDVSEMEQFDFDKVDYRKKR